MDSTTMPRGSTADEVKKPSDATAMAEHGATTPSSSDTYDMPSSAPNKNPEQYVRKINGEVQIVPRDMAAAAVVLPFDRTGEHWQAMAVQENELSKVLQQRNAEVASSVQDALNTTNSIITLLRPRLSALEGSAELIDLLVEELAIIVSVTKDVLASTGDDLQQERSILTSGYSCILAAAAQRCVGQQQAIQILQAAAASQCASADEQNKKISQVLMQNGLLRAELEETKKELVRVTEMRDSVALQRDDAERKCMQYMQQLNQLGDFALSVKEGLSALKKHSAVE